eukprot:TRINITY_DN3334_c0_g1_i2.p1 TRINITY_DN3334_c0_g1~~TRINITY_DN3334_c0_g1_i2.p1  ORF type:complete len:300 (-),score=11.27 TRINITY_DN3334_c0_g1_i2:40-939(-)
MAQESTSVAKAAAIDFTAGTVAGMVAKCIEYPFDTLKTRLQTASSFSGTFDCFRQTIQSDGFRGLYKGLTVPLGGAMLENALMFGSYGFAKKVLQETGWLASKSQPATDLSLPQTAAAGGFSGLVVSLWLGPLELVKCRLQAKHTAGLYRTPLHCVRTIYAEEGLAAFSKGFAPTVLRESLGTAMYFSTYEVVCRLLTPEGKTRQELGALSMVCAGSAAGVGYWLSIFPFDLIKSRLQTDISQSSHKVSVARSLINLCRQEGLGGMYRGIGITLVRAVPANACIFLTYENVSRFLNNNT